METELTSGESSKDVLVVVRVRCSDVQTVDVLTCVDLLVRSKELDVLLALRHARFLPDVLDECAGLRG